MPLATDLSPFSTPFRLHPLWHTDLLPFLSSASLLLGKRPKSWCGDGDDVDREEDPLVDFDVDYEGEAEAVALPPRPARQAKRANAKGGPKKTRKRKEKEPANEDNFEAMGAPPPNAPAAPTLHPITTNPLIVLDQPIENMDTAGREEIADLLDAEAEALRKKRNRERGLKGWETRRRNSNASNASDNNNNVA